MMQIFSSMQPVYSRSLRHCVAASYCYSATMALNWTMLGPDRTPVPLPRESTVTSIESGAEIAITIPDAPPSGSSSSGGSGGSKKLKEEGRAYLTDQRVRAQQSSGYPDGSFCAG